jgi:hypothetical protein
MFSGKRAARSGMTPAEAVVTDVQLLSRGMGGQWRYQLRLRVHCAGQPPFEADHKGSFEHMVAIGEVLPVRCDFGQGRVEIDVQRLLAATAATAAARHQEAVAAAEAALADGAQDGDAGVARDLQGAGQPEGPDPGAATGGGQIRLERLRQLADLRDRGAITDAEFATEKAKILGESSQASH